MNGRGLFTAIFAGEKVDRLPPPGIGPWGQTLQRWHGEGLGEGEDFYRKLGFKWDEPAATLPLNLNMAPTFEVKVLARDDRYVTLVDEYGVTKKMIRDDFERSGGLKSNAGATSGMSQWLDFPVKDLRTWKELRESRFRSDNIRDRLPDDWFNGGRERHVEHAQTRWVEYFVFPLVGFFGPMRVRWGWRAWCSPWPTSRAWCTRSSATLPTTGWPASARSCGMASGWTCSASSRTCARRRGR